MSRAPALALAVLALTTAVSARDDYTTLVSCPVATTTEVRPLSVRSLKPLSAAPLTETTFVAWAYPSAPRPTGGCAPDAAVPFPAGEPLAVPGSSGATLVHDGHNVNVTVSSQAGSLPIPADATVAACKEGSVYYVRVVAPDGAMLEELAMNADTRCLSATGVHIASIQGATSAEQTSDPSFAANAGVPLPDGYAPTPVPPPTTPLTANPCIQQDAGYSTGLAAAFYETPFGAAADARKSQPGLDFGGAPAFRRCDCPNHKIANGTWPGAPSLPTSLTTDYGVELSGEFLVERPPGGVAGEGPDLFPTASDYHLVCLQHNDAASMTIDGGSVYESGWTTETSAGFKQYCTPVLLTPGWHSVAIKYANSPATLGGASVLRLFVIDAEQVNSIAVDGTPSYEIVWQGQGRCCTSSSPATAGPSCMAPLDCCRFRSAGTCGAGAPPTAVHAPAPAKPTGTPSKITKPASPKPAPTVPAPSTPVPTPAATSEPDVFVSIPAAPAPAAPESAAVRHATPPPTTPAPIRPTANLNEVVSGGCPPSAPLDIQTNVTGIKGRPDGASDVTLMVKAAVPGVQAAALAVKVAAAGAAAVAFDCTSAGDAAFTCTGALELASPFDCLNTPLVVSAAVLAGPRGDGQKCNAAEGKGTTDACQQPVCQLFAVDMGFCGREGLVTDRPGALLIMACSQPIHACGDCFAVTGPARGAASLAAAPASNSSYQVQVSWEDGYRGPVTVAAEPMRASGACEFALPEPACGYSTVSPVDAVTFTVTDDVPVKAAAYTILQGCGGGSCGSTVV